MVATREAGDSATATSPSATESGGAGGSRTRATGSAGMTDVMAVAGAASTMPAGGKTGSTTCAGIGTGTGIPGVRGGVTLIAMPIVAAGVMTGVSNAATPAVAVTMTETIVPVAPATHSGGAMTAPMVAANTSPAASTVAGTMSSTMSRIPV